MKKVYIDPACNFLYSSFYIRGLLDFFGKYSVGFSDAHFVELRYNLHTHVFAFVCAGKKYVIDFADSNQIFYEDFLEWADVYAKVNYNSEHIPNVYAHKIVKCGCNYGMAIYSHKWMAALVAMRNWYLCHHRISFTFTQFLSRYLMSVKRKEMVFTRNAERSNYIFFVSTLWKGQDKCNQARINFIRACHNLQAAGLVVFEGGLLPDVEQDTTGIEDVLLKERISYKEYATKVAQSCCVFNTPAYFDCHGWKLAEYIAMKKIIISTPFVNELPEAMIDKINILFCDNSVIGIESTIKSLIADDRLKVNIQKGINNYSLGYACPEKVIEGILSYET